jgi:hypothetical protein
VPCSGESGAGTTTISWDTGSESVGQVWVSLNGGIQTLFGQGSTGMQNAPWISCGSTFEFELFAGTTHTTELASVLVTTL